MGKTTKKKAEGKKDHHDVDSAQDPSAPPGEAEASPSGKTKQNGEDEAEGVRTGDAAPPG